MCYAETWRGEPDVLAEVLCVGSAGFGTTKANCGLPVFFSHVHFAHQVQLVAVWQELCQSDLSLHRQLSELYDTLLGTWHSQLQWAAQVQSQPPALVPHQQQGCCVIDIKAALSLSSVS